MPQTKRHTTTEARAIRAPNPKGRSREGGSGGSARCHGARGYRAPPDGSLTRERSGTDALSLCGQGEQSNLTGPESRATGLWRMRAGGKNASTGGGQGCPSKPDTGGAVTRTGVAARAARLFKRKGIDSQGRSATLFIRLCLRQNARAKTKALSRESVSVFHGAAAFFFNQRCKKGQHPR